MTPRSRLAAFVILTAASVTAPVAASTGARAASFTVIDDKAAEEIGETTRLYIDSRLVADFKLDGVVDHKQIQITAPDTTGTTSHQYVLCGEITYRNGSGARLVRQVSGQGSLLAPDGRTFMAVGAEDFTVFYLLDPSDRAATAPDPKPSPFCQAPIS